MEWSGVEWSGVEWSGERERVMQVEWRESDASGVEREWCKWSGERVMQVEWSHSLSLSTPLASLSLSLHSTCITLSPLQRERERESDASGVKWSERQVWGTCWWENFLRSKQLLFFVADNAIICQKWWLRNFSKNQLDLKMKFNRSLFCLEVGILSNKLWKSCGLRVQIYTLSQK